MWGNRKLNGGAPLRIVFLILFFLPASYSESRASWLIDPEAFHASVHGRMTCRDCHGGILQERLHPNPEEITKRSSDSFDQAQCFACHDDVRDRLSINLHGSRQIEDSVQYEKCIACHDPHSQRMLGKESTLDPKMSRQSRCNGCHDQQTDLPALSNEDKACMSCHSGEAANDPKSADRMKRICFGCHGEGENQAQKLTALRLPLIRFQEYEKTPHAAMNCMVCHPESAAFNHANQESGDCRLCHRQHPEKVAHDAHLGVSCEACHLKGIMPVKDPEFGDVLWTKEQKPGEISKIHAMTIDKSNHDVCRRCHVAGNQVGAAAMVLPAKSMLCMPCHTGTFSLGDTTTILGVTAFFAGMVLFLAPALTGRTGKPRMGFSTFPRLIREGITALFSRKIASMVRLFLLDVLLQRRLYQNSKIRWAIHGLISYPFAFRFIWGLAALIGTLEFPELGWIWEMVDKNHPLTGFLFDLTGIMLLLGLGLAFIRGVRNKGRRIPGVPGQDRIALVLIAAIAVAGFVLQGMRIAMTGSPEGSEYSFLGYAVSLMFESRSSAIAESYGYLWYVHAVLTGCFIAYLPFSRLLHVILAPWVLASRVEDKRL